MEVKHRHYLNPLLTSLWVLCVNVRVAISLLADELAHALDQRQLRLEQGGRRRAGDRSGFIDGPGYLTGSGLGSLEIGASGTPLGE